MTLEVSIGTGRTEHEAEAQARLSLSDSPQAARRAASSPARGRAAAGGLASAGTGLADETGLADLARQLQARRAAVRSPGDSLSRLRALETLSKLAQKLTADSAPVVDAELTGQLLSVTPRTARRQLRALVEEGLALPLPPARQQHPGRPRLAYRLVIEKLERRAQ